MDSDARNDRQHWTARIFLLCAMFVLVSIVWAVAVNHIANNCTVN